MISRWDSLENNMEIFFTVSLCNSSKMFSVGVETGCIIGWIGWYTGSTIGWTTGWIGTGVLHDWLLYIILLNSSFEFIRSFLECFL